jgi:hypothetical protein
LVWIEGDRIDLHSVRFQLAEIQNIRDQG